MSAPALARVAPLSSGRLLLGGGVLFSLTPWATPGLALALGALLALTVGTPVPDATARVGKGLLQAEVVGLGFGLPLDVLVTAGRSGVLYTVAGIALAMSLGLLLGWLLRVGRLTSLLITVGTSICGGSAIAALGPAIGAGAEAMSVSLATVFVLNAVALYLFPVVGHLLHLGQHQFAIWAAIAIHDTSSVVGAAASYGPAALQEATVLKLARALWIIPLTVGAAAITRRGDGPQAVSRPVAIPWFIGLFLVAALVRSVGPASLLVVWEALAHLARAALVVTLFLIGAGLSRGTLRSVGVRPLLQGAVLWLLVGGLTLFSVWRWVPA